MAQQLFIYGMPMINLSQLEDGDGESDAVA